MTCTHVVVLSSHLLILTSTHILLSSSRLICTSAHIIFTSLHVLIFTCHIYTYQPHILTSSYLHMFSLSLSLSFPPSLCPTLSFSPSLAFLPCARLLHLLGGERRLVDLLLDRCEVGRQTGHCVLGAAAVSGPRKLPSEEQSRVNASFRTTDPTPLPWFFP